MTSVDPTLTKRRRQRSGTARQADSHRYTLRVPLVDTSVADWWDAQDDPSASVRALIREEIMRHGFTDTVNRPVVQMPRRGRPPLSGLEQDADQDQDFEREQDLQPGPSPVARELDSGDRPEGGDRSAVAPDVSSGPAAPVPVEPAPAVPVPSAPAAPAPEPDAVSPVPVVPAAPVAPAAQTPDPEPAQPLRRSRTLPVAEQAVVESRIPESAPEPDSGVAAGAAPREQLNMDDIFGHGN